MFLPDTHLTGEEEKLSKSYGVQQQNTETYTNLGHRRVEVLEVNSDKIQWWGEGKREDSERLENPSQGNREKNH